MICITNAHVQNWSNSCLTIIDRLCWFRILIRFDALPLHFEALEPNDDGDSNSRSLDQLKTYRTLRWTYFSVYATSTSSLVSH